MVGNHAINAIVLKDFSTSLQIKSFARGFNYNWFIIKEFLATESFRLASQGAMGHPYRGHLKRFSTSSSKQSSGDGQYPYSKRNYVFDKCLKSQTRW